MRDIVLREEFPVTVEEFYMLCFRDAEFTQLFHEKQGNTDTQVGQWSVGPEGRKMRVVRYVSPTASNSSMRKVAGVTTRVKEIQLSFFSQDTNEFHLTTTSLFEKAVVDIDSRVKWVVAPRSDGTRGCVCTITASSDFKGNLFKESIEKYVEDNNRIAFRNWLDLAREKVADLVPVVPLRPPSAQYMRRTTPSSTTPSTITTSTTSTTNAPLTHSLPSYRRTVTNEGKGKKKMRAGDSENEDRGGESDVDDNNGRNRNNKRTTHSRYNNDEETEGRRRAAHSDDDDDEYDDEEASRWVYDRQEDQFYEANDELAAVVRLDSTATTEQRLAVLEAYSRSTQNEMDQMEQLISGIQGRVMRVESSVNTISSLNPMSMGHPFDGQPDSYALHAKQRRMTSSLRDPTSIFEEDREREREREEGIQREMALQRTLSSTERRLADLEQTLALIQRQQLLESKKRSSFWGAFSWTWGVPVIMFIICWPLVSNKVGEAGLGLGSRLLLHLQKVFNQRQ